MTSSSTRGGGGGVTHCKKPTPSFLAENTNFRKILELIPPFKGGYGINIHIRDFFFGFLTFGTPNI